MSAANWENRTLWTGDNLDVLHGMNSECVDLIYLDPPFNSNKDYAAPIGSEAAGAAFKDTWTLSDVDEAWHGEIADRHPALYSIIDAAGLAHGKGMKAYLIMMAVRLLELRRVLKPTGSVYLHCDPTASHYLKMLMDCVFGRDSFQNELVWHYKNASRGKKQWANAHDILLWYAASDARPCFNRDAVLVPFESNMTEWRYSKGGQAGKPKPKGKTPDDVVTMPSLNAMAKERTGYPTQKPLALLERIIKASSNEGDIVLDPFCGCATTLVAAERLGRQWVGVDLSALAVKLVKQRLQEDAQLDAGGKGQAALLGGVTALTKPLRRTDQGKLPDYRTHKHTLYGKQEGVCTGCLTHFPFRNFTVDHVVPQSKGGGTTTTTCNCCAGHATAPRARERRLN